jgi:hypothetical protein
MSELGKTRYLHQAQITTKQKDRNQAKHWAQVAIEAAKKENLEISPDDKWLIDLAKGGELNKTN